MPKSLRFAVVLKRYRLISAPLGNSKRFDSRRFSDFSRLEFFHEKQLQVLAPVSAACRTRPLSSFKDADVHLKKNVARLHGNNTYGYTSLRLYLYVSIMHQLSDMF